MEKSASNVEKKVPQTENAVLQIRRENDRFLTWWWPVRRSLELKLRRLKESRAAAPSAPK